MSTKRVILGVVAALSFVSLAAVSASAQSYPNRLIKLVLPFPPGGPTDARYVEGECLCYGPVAGNIHGIDEWVDLESVEQTAVTVALAAAEWLGTR